MDVPGDSKTDNHAFFASCCAVAGGICFVVAIAMGLYGAMSKPVSPSVLAGAVAVGVLSIGLLANAVQLDRRD